jgi:diacylglycerol kinase family enzyme
MDARAIELVDWGHKKKIGPLAYLIAGLKALREQKPKIIVRTEGREFRGELVLIGNGHLYGGPLEIFPPADLCDGLLEICVFPRVNWLIFLRCLPDFIARQKLPECVVQRVRAAAFELDGEPAAAFELDGEWVGHLPATFSVEREKFGFQVQSQMRNGMAFCSKKIPHLGHLSGCFQMRMRCNGETGQTGLNFSH